MCMKHIRYEGKTDLCFPDLACSISFIEHFMQEIFQTNRKNKIYALEIITLHSLR